MADSLLNHTWTVHSASPLTTYSLRAAKLEENITRDLCHNGDYCRVRWVDQVEEEDGMHLMVELFVNEKLSAAIIFCFVELSRGRIADFSYSLARGISSTRDLLWSWMELKTGCVISREALHPSPSELANCVALWTLEAYHLSKLEQQEQQKSVAATSKAPSSNLVTRPLVLTFSPPESVQGRGIDELSTTVPPAALDQLCRDLESCRPLYSQSDRDRRSMKRQRLKPSSFVSADKYPHRQPLPILRAINEYVSQELGLRLDNFPLTQASCAVASIGANGRCKPLCRSLLGAFLRQTRDLVQERYCSSLEEKASNSKKKPRTRSSSTCG